MRCISRESGSVGMFSTSTDELLFPYALWFAYVAEASAIFANILLPSECISHYSAC